MVLAPYSELPLGVIRPEGWMRAQLQIQAEGFTGRLPEHWDYLGKNSAWLGGDGESWERGPYYLDGLLPLAVLLRDEKLLERARAWIEWTLGSQRANGQYGPVVNDDWWSRMVMNKVLMQFEEATGDERVLPFLLRYFHYQAQHIERAPLTTWGKARGGENLLCLQWLHQRTGESFLRDLMETTHAQTHDWTDIFTSFAYWRYQTKFDYRVHVVNVAMALKEPALYSLLSGSERDRSAASKGIEALRIHHGQLNGMFSGDEWLAGTHPSQGTELCAIVEYMFTLENLFRVLGDGSYVDILERVAFNALPAAIAEDWTSHQYVQQVNQIRCSVERRNWTLNADDSNTFGLEPNFGCCTANMHQGWPKLAARLWMSTADRGLVALSYVPCSFTTRVADGVNAGIEVESEYPFRDTATIRIHLDRSADFPLSLRMPAWCDRPVVRINGEPQRFETKSGIAVFKRSWSNNDCVAVELPMEARCETRGNNAVGILRGPLLYALPLREQWCRRTGNLPFANYEVFPERDAQWNVAIRLERRAPGKSFQLSESPVPRQPFGAGSHPVALRAKACTVSTWTEEKNSAGEIPVSPVEPEGQDTDITLVPYGSARLRIAEFPFAENR
jgi:uncharacterized protein